LRESKGCFGNNLLQSNSRHPKICVQKLMWLKF
jgi:hypothetical protein